MEQKRLRRHRKVWAEPLEVREEEKKEADGQASSIQAVRGVGVGCV